MNSNERNKETWTCADCCVNPCKCEIYPNKDNEREAFEKWAAINLNPPTDSVLSWENFAAWEAWQAATADSAPKLGKGVWLCTNCDNTESKEREVCCWKCSKGEMVYHSFDELRNSAPKLTEDLLDKVAIAIHSKLPGNGDYLEAWDKPEPYPGVTSMFREMAKAALAAAGVEFKGDGE